MRSKLRRVGDGAVIDKTFKAGEKFRPVRTENKKMQYLYESGDNVVLMDNESYEQVEIPKDVAAEALKWVPPNSDVELLMVDERPSDVQVAERRRADSHPDRPRPQGRHRLGRRQQAGDARDRHDRPGPALHRRGREGPGRHAQRRVRFAGLTGLGFRLILSGLRRETE